MSKKRLIICITTAVAVLLIVGMSIFAARQSADTPDRLLSLGEKYLTELNYEQALVQFLKVIEIDPMNPRGYTGAAEAYVGLGRTDDAVAILQQGFERTGDDGIRSILERTGDTGIRDMTDGLLANADQEQIVDDEIQDNLIDNDSDVEDLTDKERLKQQPLDGYPKTERSDFQWNSHDEGSYSIAEYDRYGNLISHHAYTSSDILDCVGIYSYDEYGIILEERWEYLRANELRSRPSVDITTYESGKRIKETIDYYNDGSIDYDIAFEYMTDHENTEWLYKRTEYCNDSSGNFKYFVTEIFDSLGNLEYYTTVESDGISTTYNPDGTVRE